MNDSHLDPPDYPEPPEWYMTIEDVIDSMDPPSEVATGLRKVLDAWEEAENERNRDPEPPAYLEEVGDPGCPTCGKPTGGYIYCSEECAPDCRHGNRPGQCASCDYDGDLAYDAARESR